MDFCQKYMGLPLWVWLIIGGVVLYYVYNNYSNQTDNFANVDKVKVLNFNTEWCKWSKKFQPEWDDFSVMSKNVKDMNIEAVDVKCDDDKNDKMCREYDIPGFPSVVIEKNGKKMLYEGEMTSKALVEYVKKI